MFGQSHLERYFAKGASRMLSDRQLQALADAEGMSGPAGRAGA
jgi:polar amino acid transport system permease protein